MERSEMKQKEYIKAKGIWYANEIKTIKKNNTHALHPVYEAFTNAWEAILDKFAVTDFSHGIICIEFYIKTMLYGKEDKIFDFDKIVIQDNGIGLDENNFERLINIRDDRKGHSNKGTGRIQFIHFFDETKIKSIFTENNETKKISVTLSKKNEFIKKNAILRVDEISTIPDTIDLSTEVLFFSPLDKNDESYYTNTTIDIIKREIIQHFLSTFCDNRNNLPKILIKRYINKTLEEQIEITQEDIPEPDKERAFTINYSKLNDKNKIEQLSTGENFILKTFIQSDAILAENALYLTSKGEIVNRIKLSSILKDEVIAGNRYLFLLSSSYIDQRINDDRGSVFLISGKDFKQQNENTLYPEAVILYENIEEETNQVIESLYPEIREKVEEKLKNIKELQDMFLLNPKTVNTLKNSIKNTDSDADILKKIYKDDAEIEAERDAEIKKQIKQIEKLMPTDKDYQKELKAQIQEFVQIIPLQNRVSLSQYVARRKLVLEIFSKILHKELDKLKNGERIDEDILHNLIFQQSTHNAEDSDLWLINEEFIYFKGFSEHKLEDIEYEGKKLFDKPFSEEDKRYLNSLGEKRLSKRPDILLFPDEGKCIIIEFKAPDVNVAEHLEQINFYASLLLNYTIEELKILSFYGYLIGESIEDRDVRGRVSSFEYSPNFHYWFKPSEKVINFNGGNNGNIYTEIIKYSDLLERAQLRNKIFIDKLEKGIK